MDLPRISIITPTFNQAHFLQQTLDSVVSQDYPNLEHIIVDAMSSDETPRILAAYAQRPGVLIIREPDRGQSDGINKGTVAASGVITSWLNSDDILCPGALHRIAEAFVRNPQAVVVYGIGGKMDRQGNVLRWVPYRSFNRKHLKTAYRVVQPAMFYRRDIFLEVGGLDIDLHYAMDWELLIRLSQGREVVSLNERIALIRYYEETKTSTGGWRRMREIAEIGKKANGYFDLNYLSFLTRNMTARMPVPGLRRAIDGLFGELGRYSPIMVSGWPDTSVR